MKKKLFTFVSLMIATALLSGCANDSKKIIQLDLHYVTDSSVPAGQTDTSTQAQLAQAANSVDNSLNQLSAIQMATNPKAQMPAPLDPKAIDMTQISSLNWAGPAEPAVRRIAAAAGYTLNVYGSTPATPPIVQINVQDQTLAEILREIQYQVEGKARIAIFPGRRVIELRYVQ